MALISTFEILLKPQLPKRITKNRPELAPLARTVLQGYFLTIANLANEPVYLSLVMTTRTPGQDPNKILTVIDSTGVDGPVSADFEPTAGGEVRKSRFSLPINAFDIALFIIQPVATNKSLLEAADFELRGYVELYLSSVSNASTVQLLVTPEHRGTFIGATPAELGEIAYCLPLASGGSLVELSKP